MNSRTRQFVLNVNRVGGHIVDVSDGRIALEIPSSVIDPTPFGEAVEALDLPPFLKDATMAQIMETLDSACMAEAFHNMVVRDKN
jgi:hypothetical protein